MLIQVVYLKCKSYEYDDIVNTARNSYGNGFKWFPHGIIGGYYIFHFENDMDALDFILKTGGTTVRPKKH